MSNCCLLKGCTSLPAAHTITHNYAALPVHTFFTGCLSLCLPALCVPCIIASASDKSKHGNNLLQLQQQSPVTCVCAACGCGNLRRVADDDEKDAHDTRYKYFILFARHGVKNSFQFVSFSRGVNPVSYTTQCP